MIIEYNLGVIKTADYIMDVEPESDDNEWRIIVSGSTEGMMKIRRKLCREVSETILI